MDTSTNQSPAPRVPLTLDIEYRRSYARQCYLGRLKNISLTGAFLQINGEDIEPSDKITITLNVSGRIRKIPAAVVWKNHAGCGVEFQPFNNRDVQIVDDLMYFVETSRENRKDILETILSKVA